MKKVFEKIIEKLEEEKMSYFLTIANTRDEKLDCAYEHTGDALDKAIEIVKQEAEQYNNGWISCSERLPEESGEYLAWVEYDEDRFIAIEEIDCDGIIKEWNCSTDYKIIAWQPLPQPYQPKGE